MSVDIREVRVYVERHYARIAGSDDVAAAFGVPVGMLRRSFRREMGIGLTAYLQRVRVEQAERLLAETDRRVSEVCRAVGWARADSGSRTFRREVGCSMRAYRRRVEGR